jgi:hypothetical protein
MLINIVTGEKIETKVLPVTSKDSLLAKARWVFDWKAEARQYDVFKLISSADEQAHGLISLQKTNGYVFARLIERVVYNTKIE